ncbi:hypothetical protein Vafri_63 [Volvox africanus]|nr:hypothetical protein Vafri_63 [Volvox africanus]
MPFALAVLSPRNARLRLAVYHGQANNEQSPAPAPASSDADRRYTLGHYYGSTNSVSGVKQLDHTKRRRDRVMDEIVEAGRRQGVPEQLLRGNLDELEALLPELTPDVSKMRAGDWVRSLACWAERKEIFVEILTAEGSCTPFVGMWCLSLFG